MFEFVLFVIKLLDIGVHLLFFQAGFELEFMKHVLTVVDRSLQALDLSQGHITLICQFVALRSHVLQLDHETVPIDVHLLKLVLYAQHLNADLLV